MSKIKEIHIFDCDGVLADSSHRYRTQICADGVERIDLQYWIDNENKTLLDSPIQENIAKFNALCADPTKYVILATARIWCELSERWAALHGVEPQMIIARRDRDDCRGGAALKITGVQRLFNLRQFAGVEQVHVHEDNVSYLKAIADRFNGIGHYYPSRQGH